MTKSQQIYPTDLNDTQWSKIRPYLPAEAATGRPREHGWRVILNGIFYVLQSGCSWRMLPSDLPPWQTVYYYFWAWRKDGLWEQLNQALRAKVRRQRHKKKPQPSATILDSQSVKTSEGGLEEVTQLLGETTSYIERSNLTSRLFNGRQVRKTLGFSKDVDCHRSAATWEDLYYNLVKPHKSLRSRVWDIPDRKWNPRTPAMASGLTDHVWTVKELLYSLPLKC